jgi:hypothetical protein
MIQFGGTWGNVRAHNGLASLVLSSESERKVKTKSTHKHLDIIGSKNRKLWHEIVIIRAITRLRFHEIDPSYKNTEYRYPLQ